jgi:hypothetical protein|tara:strand:- start:92 stop:280 length:189 start_codon:yes stop_codon:yes gene_type:complete
MLEFLQWIIGWIQVIPWLVMFASIIAACTDTPADDKIVGKVYKILDWFAINVGKAKQDAKES